MRSSQFDTEHLLSDVVGVGVGPSNLSLAALLHPTGTLNGVFLDQKPAFKWHPGLMLADATIQVHYLKDLVSLVDPTSPFSFLAFLAKKGRLLQFINASFPQVLRREFDDYYRWVSERLPGIFFDSPVDSVNFDESSLAVTSVNRRWNTRNLVIGTGLTPYIPPSAKDVLGPTVIHASQFLHNDISFSGKRVAIIGGGQTGAEVFKTLIDIKTNGPARVDWISRRSNFLPLDESAFTNELYTPDYSDYFYTMSRNTRESLLSEQKLSSDGISTCLLSAIYRRLYEIRHLDLSPIYTCLMPARELRSIKKSGYTLDLSLRHSHNTQIDMVSTDFVILATGYMSCLPHYLEPIASRISWDSGFEVYEDFSIRWDGPASCKIYVQGGARNQRGIADPNLGLMPWRNAKIINSMLGREFYELTQVSSFVDWAAPPFSATAGPSQPTAFALSK